MTTREKILSLLLLALIVMGATLSDNAIWNAIFDETEKALKITVVHESFPEVDEIALTGTLTVGGATALNGGLAMDGTAFTVTNTSGNVATEGTLTVDSTATITGLLTANGGILSDSGAFSVADTSGDVITTGTLQAVGLTSLNGGLEIDSPAFTVADTSGNVATTGTLTVGGATRLDGVVYLLQGYTYYRQTAGADTNGDWRTFTNHSGIYIQHRESNAWVTKFEVE